MFSWLGFFPYTCGTTTRVCNPNIILCRILASSNINQNNIVFCQQLMLSVILFNYFVSVSNLCSSRIPCASSFKSPLILGLNFSASQWHETAGIRDKKILALCVCALEKKQVLQRLLQITTRFLHSMFCLEYFVLLKTPVFCVCVLGLVS